MELLLTSLLCSRYIPYLGHSCAEGVAAEIERYSDRYRVNIRANRPALWSVLKLAPAYFPAELLGQGRLSFLLSFLPPRKCYGLQDTTEPALVLIKIEIHLFEGINLLCWFGFHISVHKVNLATVDVNVILSMLYFSSYRIPLTGQVGTSLIVVLLRC